jgi:DNA polymerase-3 subunit alpha
LAPTTAWQELLFQKNSRDIKRRCAEAAIDIPNRLGLPLVDTSDAHYLTKDDADAHEVLLCINTGKTRAEENRLRYGSNEFFVRPPQAKKPEDCLASCESCLEKRR